MLKEERTFRVLQERNRNTESETWETFLAPDHRKHGLPVESELGLTTGNPEIDQPGKDVQNCQQIHTEPLKREVRRKFFTHSHQEILLYTLQLALKQEETVSQHSHQNEISNI